MTGFQAPDGSSAEDATYGGHVSSEAASRLNKARKIVELLEGRIELEKADVLDLGAGSGLLSAHIRPRVASLTAADRDTRLFEPHDVPIREIRGVALPFADRSFDLVVFNHVIEHVGPRARQAEILAEIRRILRPDGLMYLGVPNRFAVIEPHYRLPFLSWLPQPLADGLLRATGRNSWYDCNPFSWPALKTSLREAGFAVENATHEAFFALLRIERPGGSLAALLSKTPQAVARAATPFMPTFVVICRPRPSADPAEAHEARNALPAR